jgi:hypothetical protein
MHCPPQDLVPAAHAPASRSGTVLPSGLAVVAASSPTQAPRESHQPLEQPASGQAKSALDGMSTQRHAPTQPASARARSNDRREPAVRALMQLPSDASARFH